MRNWLLIGFLTAISCDLFVRNNPDYCVDDSQCTSTTLCNLTYHRCDPGTVGAVVLTSITPAKATLAGGIPVVLQGMNFRVGATVTFNGVAATMVEVKSATEIDAVVPAVDGNCGAATVTVTNPQAAPVSSTTLFHFKLGMPAFTPLSGGPLAVPSDAHRIKAVDFDLDGVSDLMLLTDSPPRVSLYKIRDGSLGPSTSFDLMNTAADMIITKIDSDSYPDIMAWDSANAKVYKNLSGSSLSFASSLTGAFAGMAIGKLNDSLDVGDLVSSNSVIKQLELRLAVPGGGGPPYSGGANTLMVGQLPSALVLADFNNDARLDIVASLPVTSEAAVFLASGSGMFPPQPNASLGTPATQLVAVDLDLDGNKDLVAIGGLSMGGLGRVYGDGAGGFSSPPVVVGIAAQPQIIASGDSGFDFDCDGRPDIVVYTQSATELSIYLNNFGGRLLGLPVPVAVNDFVESFTVTDLDRDGKPDIALIVISQQTSMRSLVILRNTSQ